jgi:hypothetical protein
MDHFQDSVVALIAETINHSMETHEDQVLKTMKVMG